MITNNFAHKLLFLLSNYERGTDVNILYVKTRQYPTIIAKAIDELEKREFVKVDSFQVRITVAGLDWLRKNPYSVADSKVWREPDPNKLETRLDPYAPYVPRVSEVDPEILG